MDRAIHYAKFHIYNDECDRIYCRRTGKATEGCDDNNGNAIFIALFLLVLSHNDSYDHFNNFNNCTSEGKYTVDYVLN